MADATNFYDTRRIVHGTQNVAYAADIGGQITARATGITKFAPQTDQDSKVLYADAQTHMTLVNPAKLTVDLTQYQFNDTEMAQLGRVAANGGWIDGTEHPAFSIQRILIQQDDQGKQTKVLEAYYGCTSTDATESDDEDSDAINAKTYSRKLTVNGVNINVNGNSTPVKKFKVVRNDSNASVFDQYTSKVLTPADFASVSSKG